MIDPTLSRQALLPEVGASGQARIQSATLEVVGSDGAIIEAEYLHRAGVERLALTPGREPEPFVHESFFRFAASRRVGAGAWRALSKLRRALGLELP
ncbi:MAG: hypothetical protein HS104_10455 [Polyangiaceae bacterium]|nr:hypothetical protein [Polyangiaceae bacterium]MCE7893358.1 hypothetical protein [Sorangiineae bacterium PRO1]MCL4750965.1 hypothetical protein [Myxococcales bacterium]